MSVPEILRRAIEIGERNGKIGFDELNQLCDSEVLVSRVTSSQS